MPTLKVAEGYQIKHDGKVRKAGETLENVRNADAQRYLSAGYAEEVKESKSESKDTSSKKTTSKGAS
jgi:hypothetical protein